MNRATGAVVFLVLFAVYVGTGAPTVTWFDTGELATAAVVLGNGHPPGQPFYALLAKGATLIPVGSIPMRLMILSASAGAAAMVLLARVLERLMARLDVPQPPASIQWGLVPLAGLSLPVWLQCVRVELYSVQLLLSVLAVRVALCEVTDRRSQAMRDWTLGLILGLSAATHPLLGVLLVPGLAALATPVTLSSMVRVPVAAVVAGTTYLYLPLRARAGALLNWGDPATWERFYYVVTGKAYQHSFSTLTWARLENNLELHAVLFAGLLGMPLLLLALAGLVMAFKRWRVGVGLTLLLGGNVASTASQSAFFPDNPDALGYLSFTASLLFVLAAIGLSGAVQLARRLALSGQVRTRVVEVATGAVVLALGAEAALASWPRADLHDNWYYQTYIHQLLQPLPIGCLELSGSDASTFAGWYGLAVEGMRPDTGVLSLYTLPDTGVFRAGNLPASLPEETGGGPGEQVRALVAQVLPERPVHVTMHDLPVDLGAEMRIDVTSFRLVSPGDLVPLDDGLDALERFWSRQAQQVRTDPVYLRDRQARLRFPSHLEAVGDHLLELGLLVPAMRAYTRAEAFAQDPYRLVHLKRLRLEQRIAAVGTAGHGRPFALGDHGNPSSPARDLGGRMNHIIELLELGRWREAGKLLQRVSDGGPRTVLARAWLAYLNGRWAEARGWLARLRRLAPAGLEAETALTRFERVLPPDDAVGWMAQYLSVRPSAGIQAALANRLRELGRVDAALEAAKSAVERDPDCIAAQVALGWALVAKGRLEQAFGVLQRALEVSPTDPAALRLASYLYRRGLR